MENICPPNTKRIQKHSASCFVNSRIWRRARRWKNETLQAERGHEYLHLSCCGNCLKLWWRHCELETRMFLFIIQTLFGKNKKTILSYFRAPDGSIVAQTLFLCSPASLNMNMSISSGDLCPVETTELKHRRHVCNRQNHPEISKDREHRDL